MDEIKKCPFCGINPIVIKQPDGYKRIKCNNPDCWIMPATDLYSKLETAIEAWNERKNDETD